MVMCLGNPNVKVGVKKVCESFMGTNVEVPHMDNIPNKIRQHQQEIDETSKMITDSKKSIKEWLTGINYPNADDDISNLEAYKWLLAKEKAILTAINMMRTRQNNHIGFLWSPSVDEADI